MELKERIEAYAKAQWPVYREIALAIHAHPEVSNHEYFARDALGDQLEREGFTVARDVAGHPTGFDARYQSGRPGPVVVFLAEYDALAGLGHGCGHNLFGATSALAGACLKQVIDEVGGEVRVYGTPGEEGGENGSAKGSFVREGFLKDVDFALCAHSSSARNERTGPTLACAPVQIEFHGKASHAAAAPEKGINALDALIQVYNSINALRQQLPRDVRIHGVITHGGDAPNTIPDYAAAKFYLRAASVPTLDMVTEKVQGIVQGAALATGCTGSMAPYQNRVENVVVTPLLDDVFEKVMAGYGQQMAEPDTKVLGSSDVGNISQVVPTMQAMLSISDCPVPAHSPAFVEASKSEKGLASIELGAKALAATALALLQDPALLGQIKAQHQAAVAAQAEG